MRYVILICLFCMTNFAAFAQTPTAMEVENRARDVGRSLRCVVCQNQSIDESDAPLAADMRKRVRERIRLGDSDEQVIGYMRERYGDYVLLKPPFQGNTYLLWIAPGALLLGFLLWYGLRAKHTGMNTTVDPLNAEEQKAFDALKKRQEPKA